jgi:hypothetical protein
MACTEIIVLEQFKKRVADALTQVRYLCECVTQISVQGNRALMPRQCVYDALERAMCTCVYA